jgi:hypothetical protein
LIGLQRFLFRAILHQPAESIQDDALDKWSADQFGSAQKIEWVHNREISPAIKVTALCEKMFRERRSELPGVQRAICIE